MDQIMILTQIEVTKGKDTNMYNRLIKNITLIGLRPRCSFLGLESIRSVSGNRFTKKPTKQHVVIYFPYNTMTQITMWLCTIHLYDSLFKLKSVV